MSDDWVHPPGWDPESKAKAAADRKEKTFFQKYRPCLVPLILGSVISLLAFFTWPKDIGGDYKLTIWGLSRLAGSLAWFVIGMAFTLTTGIVIRILGGISHAESNATEESERKAARRLRKWMWAFVPTILAILIFLLMIPVTLITGDVGSLGIAVMWILLAAALTVLILVILFVTSLFDAAEKRSRRPPTD
ncbi:MAG: hypothetical protein QF645_03345 [Planctomycetota bacterium]|jgi:hypothetical protein|nr:hypothetical protein [Planctomycetota bacterium]